MSRTPSNYDAKLLASYTWSWVVEETSQVLHAICECITGECFSGSDDDDLPSGCQTQQIVKSNKYAHQLPVNIFVPYLSVHKILFVTQDGGIYLFTVSSGGALQSLARLHTITIVVELDPPVNVEQLAHNGAVYHTRSLAIVAYNAHKHAEVLLDYLLPHRHAARERCKRRTVGGPERQATHVANEVPVTAFEAVLCVEPAFVEEQPKYIVHLGCDPIAVPAITVVRAPPISTYHTKDGRHDSVARLANNLENEKQVEKFSLAFERASYQLINRIGPRFEHQASQQLVDAPEHLKLLANSSWYHRLAHFINPDIYSGQHFAEYVLSERHCAPDYDSKELKVPLDPERNVCWLKFMSTPDYDDIVTVIRVHFTTGSPKEPELWIEGPVFWSAWMTGEQANGVNANQGFLASGQTCHKMQIYVDGKIKNLVSNLPTRLAPTLGQQPYDPSIDEENSGLSAFNQEQTYLVVKPRLADCLRKTQGLTIEEWGTRNVSTEPQQDLESASHHDGARTQADSANSKEPEKEPTDVELYDAEGFLLNLSGPESPEPTKHDEDSNSLDVLTNPNRSRRSEQPPSPPHSRKNSHGNEHLTYDTEDDAMRELAAEVKVQEVEVADTQKASAAELGGEAVAAVKLEDGDGDDQVSDIIFSDADSEEDEDEDKDEDEFDKCSYITDPSLNAAENAKRRTSHRIDKLLRGTGETEAEYERWKTDPDHPHVFWDLRNPRYEPVERACGERSGEIPWELRVDFAMQKEARDETMERFFWAPVVEMRAGVAQEWSELCAEELAILEEEVRRVEDGSVEQEAAVLDCTEPALPDGVVDHLGFMAWLRKA